MSQLWLCQHRGLLPPAYVVRREGNVLTRVCSSIHPSICLSTEGGVPISHNALQHFPECHGADTWGGYPARSSRGGTLPGPAGEGPCRGVPRYGTPLSSGQGVTLLCLWYIVRTTVSVLTTQQEICLLGSSPAGLSCSKIPRTVISRMQLNLADCQ